MSKILFVVGAPGVGKTTLVRGLLGMSPEGELPIGGYLVEKPKWTVTPTICAAGHYTGGTFDGADMVPYNGAVAALDYWKAGLADKALTIFDGDRFSNASALVLLKGHEIVGVHLVASDEVLEARRRERGSNQNATWMKGRVTKAANFAKTIGAYEIRATSEPQELLGQVRAIIGSHGPVQ